jgi:hypothetical protein
MQATNKSGWARSPVINSGTSFVGDADLQRPHSAGALKARGALRHVMPPRLSMSNSLSRLEKSASSYLVVSDVSSPLQPLQPQRLDGNLVKVGLPSVGFSKKATGDLSESDDAGSVAVESVNSMNSLGVAFSTEKQPRKQQGSGKGSKDLGKLNRLSVTGNLRNRRLSVVSEASNASDAQQFYGRKSTHIRPLAVEQCDGPAAQSWGRMMLEDESWPARVFRSADGDDTVAQGYLLPAEFASMIARLAFWLGDVPKHHRANFSWSFQAVDTDQDGRVSGQARRSAGRRGGSR